MLSFSPCLSLPLILSFYRSACFLPTPAVSGNQLPLSFLLPIVQTAAHMGLLPAVSCNVNPLHSVSPPEPDNKATGWEGIPGHQEAELLRSFPPWEVEAILFIFLALLSFCCASPGLNAFFIQHCMMYYIFGLGGFFFPGLNSSC